MVSVDNNHRRTTAVDSSRQHVMEAGGKEDPLEKWRPTQGGEPREPDHPHGARYGGGERVIALGTQVIRDIQTGSLVIIQEEYIRSLLVKYGMQ